MGIMENEAPKLVFSCEVLNEMESETTWNIPLDENHSHCHVSWAAGVMFTTDCHLYEISLFYSKLWMNTSSSALV